MDKEILQKDEPQWCTLHSNDANHQAANLVNWQQEFDQLSQGHFIGEIKERHFPHVHVFREDTSHSLRQQCRVEGEGLWLGFSANEKSCRINHEQTTNHQFLCRPGSRDFELVTPEHFSIYGLVLHPSFFSELVEQENQPLFDNDCDGLWLENITATEANNFKQYLALLLQPKSDRWSNHTHEHILQDAVIELLSNAQQAPITMNEICAAVHVSRRTLQYTFTQCYGIPPKQYIQALRLNQVRRELFQKDESQTIADIAINYGFFHLAQFSQSYKRLFGETPQQTRQSF